MTETLAAALKQRIAAVLESGRVTEVELRQLAEEGRACARLMDGQLERREQRLAELSTEPDSSVADMAAALREVSELRPDIEQLGKLLEALDARAHDLRAAWLSAT